MKSYAFLNLRPWGSRGLFCSFLKVLKQKCRANEFSLAQRQSKNHRRQRQPNEHTGDGSHELPVMTFETIRDSELLLFCSCVCF